MTKLLLGCIADDFTGATDLANNLVRAGMRVVQTIGMPTAPLGEAADAVVVALKSRTLVPADAVAQSLAACTASIANARIALAHWVRIDNAAAEVAFMVGSSRVK